MSRHQQELPAPRAVGAAATRSGSVATRLRLIGCEWCTFQFPKVVHFSVPLDVQRWELGIRSPL
jgi:hypothetical protein